MSPKLIVLSCVVIVLFALGSFFGKIALLKDTSYRVYFFEAVGTLTVFTLFTLLNRREIFEEGFAPNPFGLLMGLSWGVGTVLFIYVLHGGRASVIVPFTALYPAVTVLLAMVFLKEALEPRELLGVVMAVVAGLLLAR